MSNLRWTSRLIVALAVTALGGCGTPPGEVAEAGGGSGGSVGSGGSAGGGDDPLCVESSDGEKVCPDPKQRYTQWDTYAVRGDGRTVDVTFSAPGEDCAAIEEAAGEVLPTEVHVAVSLRAIRNGCDLVDRTATVTLSEPVAGRPLYSTYATAGGGGMSSRGYAGTSDGPECLGPRPAPRAEVDHCPQPTNQPPGPLETTPNPRLDEGRTVPWASAGLRDRTRRVVLQWVSTDCARLAEAKVLESGPKRAVVLTLREVPCKGAVVVRATTVDLGGPLGDRRIIDGTAYMP